MAGLGRRTHYRKHLTDSVLNDLPEPQQDESIALVVATRGSNQFDVQLPHSPQHQLAILPTKFRKLIWLKRNDFVIVQTAPEGGVDDTLGKDGESNEDNGEEGETDHGDNSDAPKSSESTAALSENVVPTGDNEETGSIRCIVSHILYSEQIKHLRSKGLWPTDDPAFETNQKSPDDGPEATETTSNSTVLDDGIVYDQGYGSESENDDDLFVNTNRISRITIQDDSSDEEEEE